MLFTAACSGIDEEAITPRYEMWNKGRRGCRQANSRVKVFQENSKLLVSSFWDLVFGILVLGIIISSFGDRVKVANPAIRK
jgi:hypothetical protein